MPRDNHYDFICDLDPSHRATGFTSANLPPGWTRVTTIYNDLRGNDIGPALTICPVDSLRLATYALSLCTPDAAAFAPLTASVALAQEVGIPSV